MKNKVMWILVWMFMSLRWFGAICIVQREHGWIGYNTGGVKPWTVSSEPEICPFHVKIMRDWTLQVTTRLVTRKRSETLIPFSDWFFSLTGCLRQYGHSQITYTKCLRACVRKCMHVNLLPWTCASVHIHSDVVRDRLNEMQQGKH